MIRDPPVLHCSILPLYCTEEDCCQKWFGPSLPPCTVSQGSPEGDWCRCTVYPLAVQHSTLDNNTMKYNIWHFNTVQYSTEHKRVVLNTSLYWCAGVHCTTPQSSGLNSRSVIKPQQGAKGPGQGRAGQGINYTIKSCNLFTSLPKYLTSHATLLGDTQQKRLDRTNSVIQWFFL